METTLNARQARRKLGSRRTRKVARKVLKNQRPMGAILRDQKVKARAKDRTV